MLRRTKNLVLKSLPPKKKVHLFVGLTEVQLGIYKNMLLNKSLSSGNKTHFVNILMQLRKCCNHPYLFEGIEEEGLPALGHHLITVSGKMQVLDKLLIKLKAGSH